MPEIFFKLPDLTPEEAHRLEQNIHALIISKALFIKGGNFTTHLNENNQVAKIEADYTLYKLQKELK